MRTTLIAGLFGLGLTATAQAGELPVIWYTFDGEVVAMSRGGEVVGQRLGAGATTALAPDVVAELNTTLQFGKRAELAALLAQIDAEMAARTLATQ